MDKRWVGGWIKGGWVDKRGCVEMKEEGGRMKCRWMDKRWVGG